MLIDVPVCKDGASNYTVVVQAEVNKAFTIIIHHVTTMFAHGSFAVEVFRTNFVIHVSDYQKHIVLWLFGDNGTGTSYKGQQRGKEERKNGQAKLQKKQNKLQIANT